MLDELAGVHAARELRVVEEVVVDAVALAGARRARRGRDAQLERGQPLAQRPDQRPLAHPRRAGDDEDLRHGGGGDLRRRRAYLRRSETSSVRWRSERPPIVLLGEMRQVCRTLFALTRPYLGPPAAGRTPSPWRGSPGASRSSPSMDTRPPLRSRLSCARRVRISFARRSASMRWWRLRSGAARAWSGSSWPAHGAASLHTDRGPRPRRGPNSPPPRSEVEGSSARSRVGARFAGVFLGTSRVVPGVAGPETRTLRVFRPRRRGMPAGDRSDTPIGLPGAPGPTAGRRAGGGRRAIRVSRPSRSRRRRSRSRRGGPAPRARRCMADGQSGPP